MLHHMLCQSQQTSDRTSPAPFPGGQIILHPTVRAIKAQNWLNNGCNFDQAFSCSHLHFHAATNAITRNACRNNSSVALLPSQAVLAPTFARNCKGVKPLLLLQTGAVRPMHTPSEVLRIKYKVTRIDAIIIICFAR